MSERASYVYVIVAASHVEIGIAAAVLRRLSQLQIGSPVQLALHYQTGPKLREIAQQIEYRAHYLLREKRAFGEWFACTPEEAVETINAATAYVRNRRGNLGYHPNIQRLKTLGKLSNGVDLLTASRGRPRGHAQ